MDEITDRFANMWIKSREDAGKSQEFMAKALGVSKKTIQNWESGITCPSQKVGFEWFSVLGLQPLPYYLEVIYPSNYSKLSKGSVSPDVVDKALTEGINGLPDDAKRKLLYILFGGHGSSIIGIIEMITAHLQCPLRDRLNIAQSISLNYEIASAKGLLKNPDHVQPNTKMLDLALQRGKDAVKNGNGDYNVII